MLGGPTALPKCSYDEAASQASFLVWIDTRIYSICGTIRNEMVSFRVRLQWTGYHSMGHLPQSQERGSSYRQLYRWNTQAKALQKAETRRIDPTRSAILLRHLRLSSSSFSLYQRMPNQTWITACHLGLSQWFWPQSAFLGNGHP